MHCRQAEEERQAIALAKQQAAEAKERELAAQRAQREAERQALRRLQRNFGVRVEGHVSIDKPAKVSLHNLMLPTTDITALQIAVMLWQHQLAS